MYIFTSFFVWICTNSWFVKVFFFCYSTTPKGGIIINLQKALEAVCADAVNQFLDSNEMMKYLEEFLYDNAELILSHQEEFKENDIPVKCNIKIKVDLKVDA